MLVETTNEAWLSKSLVGRLHEPEKIFDLQDMFILDALSSIKAQYIGDNRVLLIGHDSDILLLDMSDNRLVWVRYKRLPLNTWNEVGFGRVVVPIGTLVAIAKETKNK